ncbi:MAG: low molecular weight protein-tyrosine-phosphatase [bacterium]|jgi:protein-tyrosine phosphatase|nr:MAG: phosphotyrosine protein phosphatase [bacterium]
MTGKKTSVLFVCLGNICRSPLAEAVFRKQVKEAGLEDLVEVDSAGTSSYHEGEGPDPRTVRVARARGVEMTGRARQIRREDAERFDYIIAMDEMNLRDVQRLVAEAGVRSPRVMRLREFDPEAHGDLDVPDPYYGGPQGFEKVHDIVERSCAALLRHIVAERGLDAGVGRRAEP